MKKGHLFTLVLYLGLGGSVVSLSNVHAEEEGQGVLRVVDHQQAPIAEAEVTVGLSVGDPFSGNVLTTDAGGEAEKPVQWNRELPVTIQSKDHILTTYIDTSPDREVFSVSDRETKDFISIRGDIGGYGRLKNGDKKVDFSLVLPALTRRQLLNFDISTILSPKDDAINLPMGKKLNLPSNVSIPKQKESYGFFPIDLNKPSYGLMTRRYGDQRLVAIRGRFPLKPVVDGFRKNQFILGLVNHFHFLSGGQLEVHVGGAIKGQDMVADTWQLNDHFEIQAPEYGKQRAMVSVSLMENTHGELFPMDIKMIRSNGSQVLKSRQYNKARYAMSVLLAKVPGGEQGGLSFHQLSMAVNSVSVDKQGQNLKVTPHFLNLIAPPKILNSVGGRAVLALTPPQAVEEIFPVATYVVLSQIESVPDSSIKASKKTRLWEVFNNFWVSEVEIPDIQIDLNSGKEHIWEVIYLGSDREIAPGENWTFNDISHVTRNVLEI